MTTTTEEGGGGGRGWGGGGGVVLQTGAGAREGPVLRIIAGSNKLRRQRK